ncbi:MAG: hypothetical protein D6788_08880 [Planctomycetota bacterium]|nr:MAG: hypothetical protein D6788_08880 [Planctomycetota bacterium]
MKMLEMNPNPSRGDVLRNVWMDAVLFIPIVAGFPFADWFLKDSAVYLVLFALWTYACILVGILLGWGLVALLERWRPAGAFLDQPARSRAARFVGRLPPGRLFRFLAVYMGIVMTVLLAGSLVQRGFVLLPAPRWNAPGTLLFALLALLAIVLATFATHRFARRAGMRGEAGMERGHS